MRGKTVVALLVLMCAAVACSAQGVPDAPQPKPDAYHEHAFYDTRNSVALGVMITARGADSIATCRALASGAREAWLPAQSCRGVSLLNLAFTGAGVGSAYLLHVTDHHKLERVPMWASAIGSLAAMAYAAVDQQKLHTVAGPAAHRL